MRPALLFAWLLGGLPLAGCDGGAGTGPGSSSATASVAATTGSAPASATASGATATGATASGATATSTAASSSGGAVFSCDLSVSGTHECAEYADLPDADLPTVQSACAARMGTPGSGCPSTGERLGTCAIDEGGLAETVIFYAGAGLTGFEAQGYCTSNGGTWTAG